MGSSLVSPSAIASVLNHYFCSIFTNEDLSNLSSLENSLKRFESAHSIADIPFIEIDVYNELCKIDPSKACGPDGILLRQGVPCLSEPLFKLFKMSLKTGILPDEWTYANFMLSNPLITALSV